MTVALPGWNGVLSSRARIGVMPIPAPTITTWFRLRAAVLNSP